MVALDDAGFGISRYHADRGFKTQLTLALEEADILLLERFAREVKAAAVSCINFASCFNAAGFSKVLALPIGMADFAPTYPHSFQAVKSSRLFNELTPPVRAGLDGFTYYLRAMRDDLVPLLTRNATHGGVTRDDVTDIRDVTNTASCFAKLTLKDLVAIEGRLASEYEVAHMSYLITLLDDVLEGRSPLLVNGQLEKARTDFLVRERRVDINAEATVSDPSAKERVIVSNISQGGLSFRCTGAFKPGQKIRVRLMTSGRELLGRIVWRNGQKAGVTFYYPLDPGDDLLLPA